MFKKGVLTMNYFLSIKNFIIKKIEDIIFFLIGFNAGAFYFSNSFTSAIMLVTLSILLALEYFTEFNLKERLKETTFFNLFVIIFAVIGINALIF